MLRALVRWSLELELAAIEPECFLDVLHLFREIYEHSLVDTLAPHIVPEILALHAPDRIITKHVVGDCGFDQS
jgi:hypothetical protein